MKLLNSIKEGIMVFLIIFVGASGMILPIFFIQSPIFALVVAGSWVVGYLYAVIDYFK